MSLQSLAATAPLAAMLASLKDTGYTLVRDFPAALDFFEQFTSQFCRTFHEVGTRQPVEALDSDGKTSEVPSRNFNLFVHSEGAYRAVPPPPDLCFFNCLVAPTVAGGETTLVDGVEFLQRLDLFVTQAGLKVRKP